MLPCAAPWTQDPITVATVVIAAATVLNLFVSAGLFVATYLTARTAKQVFEAANRPYLGMERLRPDIDKGKKELRIKAFVKNFGSAPAEEAAINWELFYNGILQDPARAPAALTTVFPSGILHKRATIGEPVFGQIMAHAVTLQLIIRFSYKGPANKTYAHNEKAQYEPSINSFMMLGETVK